MNLIDVNVLIALADPSHTHRSQAKAWFRDAAREGWATCPITENAFIRILGQPAYPNGPQCPTGALQILKHLTSLPGHQFWNDTLSLTDEERFRIHSKTTSKQITDLYLLAMAVARGGRLITFDRRIDADSVVNGVRSITNLETY